MPIKTRITTLFALIGMMAGLGVLVLATVLWATALAGMALFALLAMALPGKPVRARVLIARARP